MLARKLRVVNRLLTRTGVRVSIPLERLFYRLSVLPEDGTKEQLTAVRTKARFLPRKDRLLITFCYSNREELIVSRHYSTKLSPRQQKMLDFVRRFVLDHSYPPTIREIGLAAGISSTSVVDYNLNALERMGYLRRDPEISRGIALPEEGQEHSSSGRTRTEVREAKAEGILSTGRLLKLPVVGRIAAGEPIEAVAGADETIDLTDSLAPENAYVLKVKGKSMIEDFIDDGDMVVIQPQATAENGDIVVALLTDGPTGEGQATLKRLYREKGVVRLQPANATMEPIYVEPDKLLIQGKVVSVIRQLR